MIKADIKSCALGGNKINVQVKIDVDGPYKIVEKELYLFLREFKNKKPEILTNVIGRLIDDMMEGEDEK